MDKNGGNEIQPQRSSIGHQAHDLLSIDREEISQENLERPISEIQRSPISEDQTHYHDTDINTKPFPQANSNFDNFQNYGWHHDNECETLHSNSLLADQVDYLPCYDSATSVPSAPPLSPEIYLQDRPGSNDVEEKEVSVVLNLQEEDRLSSIKIFRKDVKKISVHVNLLTASKRLLNMLKKVEQEKNLYSGKKVIAAIYRYEQIWLPIVANNKPELAITPPLDVHWVWIVHMLAPQCYNQDCINITGKIIPHRLITGKASEKSIELGKAIWMKLHPIEPWDLTEDHLSNPIYFSSTSRISYNLEDAISRQSAFYYQVSLDHYRLKPFLYKAVFRYKQFLALKKATPNLFVVPCYDMDIVWHAHLVHPVIYRSDTEKIIGKLFSHDDSVNDRSEGSKLCVSDNLTRVLWSKAFHTTFRREGSMFRGDPPIKYMSNFPKSVERSAHMSIFYIHITKIKINGNFGNGPLQVKLKREGEKLANFTLVHYEEDMPQLDVTEMELYFTMPEHALSQWIVLKISSKKTLGKILKILGKGNFWCMTNFSELFSIDDVGTVSKIFLDEDSSATVELEMFVTRERTNNWVPIGIMTGDFMPHVLDPQEMISHFGMVTGSQSDNQDIYLSEMATHRLLNESSISKPHLLEVEVCHSRHFMFSSIKIYADSLDKGRSLVCMAHTLDLNTIPSPSELKYSTSSQINQAVTTLNLPSGERVMIIKSRGRDWALISGRWEGLKRGIKGSFSSRGVPGNPGHLVVKIYNPIGSLPYTITLPYDKQIYAFQLPNLLIDMENGMIKVGRDSAEFVEQVALGLAITVLHVLCQPRLLNVEVDTVDNASISAAISDAPKRIPTERLKFLAALGFFCASAPTNTFLHNNLKSKTPNGDYVGNSFGYPLMTFPMITTDVGSCGGCGGCGGGVFETLPTPSTTLWGSSHCGTDSGAYGPDWSGGDAQDWGSSGGQADSKNIFDLIFESGEAGDGGGGDGGGCGGGCGGCGG